MKRASKSKSMNFGPIIIDKNALNEILDEYSSIKSAKIESGGYIYEDKNEFLKNAKRLIV